MRVSCQLVLTLWGSPGKASPLQHEGTCGGLEVILILIQVVKICQAGPYMLVRFCMYVSYTLPASPLLPQPSQAFFLFSHFFPLPGLTSANPRQELLLSSPLPLCGQSMCFLHPAFPSFPSSPFSSSRKPSRSPRRGDEGEVALLR